MNVASAALLCAHSPPNELRSNHLPASLARDARYLADFAQAAGVKVEQEDLVHELALTHA